MSLTIEPAAVKTVGNLTAFASMEAYEKLYFFKKHIDFLRFLWYCIVTGYIKTKQREETKNETNKSRMV